jgi:hypothetical protein
VIDRPPMELMQMKNWSDVPYLVGYNSDESMFMQREHLIDFGVHRFFNTNPWSWTPILWNIPRSHPDNAAIMRTFQDLYFEGQEPSRDWDMEWTWVRVRGLEALSGYNNLFLAFSVSKRSRFHLWHR